MPNELPEIVLEYPDVRQGIGHITEPRSKSFKEILTAFGLPSGRYGVAVYWPNGFRAFGMKVSFVASQVADQKNRPPISNAAGGRRSDVSAPAAVSSREYFKKTPADWKALMMSCGHSMESLETDDVETHLNQHHVLTATVDADRELRFDVDLDTDCPQLLGYLKRAAEGQTVRLKQVELTATEVAIRPYFQVFTLSPDGTVETPSEAVTGQLVFRFSNLTKLANFSGFVAIDFGNTSSTFACMKELSRRAQDVEVTNVDPDRTGASGRGDEGAVLSSVAITSYAPPVEAREANAVEEVNAVEWVIGQATLERDPDSLIPGPKRLLAGPQDIGLPIRVDGMSYEIKKILPAELLLSQMLKESYKIHLSKPKQLAVTYPSTFSSSEIKRLQQAVARGINRSQCYPFHDFRSDDVNEWIPLMLDEATAASFFFLYRDFFYEAGRIPAFSYVYEHGVNVLIFDCGGGTTDVVLVHATAEGGPRAANTEDAKIGEVEKHGIPSAGQDRRTIRVEVLGRTGLRRFGGDDITIAVFKVLKAELAVTLSRGKDVSLRIPEKAEAFDRWYESKRDSIDKYVPTQFKEANRHLDPDAYNASRRLTKAFWKWAEEVKEWLGKVEDADTTPQPAPSGSDEEPSRESRALIVKNFPLPPVGSPLRLLLAQSTGGDGRQAAPASAIDSKLGQVMAERGTLVNALIRDSLEKCLDNTNRMIRERLTDLTRKRVGRVSDDRVPTDLPPDSEVHRVYVVGNGSRYPLVQKLIDQKLRVRRIPSKRTGGREPWWSDADPHLKRIVFDTTNLKNSVAKGAVLALRVSSDFPDAHFEWDHRLSQRLPYTISFDSLQGPLDLYNEHELYGDILDKLRPLAQPTGDAKKKQRITLDRQWPGDDSDEPPAPFLSFQFTEPLQGPLFVTYKEDDDHPRFEVLDEGTGEVVQGEEIPDAGDMPPMLRGDL